jgi:hypothetical protein
MLPRLVEAGPDHVPHRRMGATRRQHFAKAIYLEVFYIPFIWKNQPW